MCIGTLVQRGAKLPPGMWRVCKGIPVHHEQAVRHRSWPDPTARVASSSQTLPCPKALLKLGAPVHYEQTVRWAYPKPNAGPLTPKHEGQWRLRQVCTGAPVHYEQTVRPHRQCRLVLPNPPLSQRTSELGAQT